MYFLVLFSLAATLILFLLLAIGMYLFNLHMNLAPRIHSCDGKFNKMTTMLVHACKKFIKKIRSFGHLHFGGVIP